MVSLLNSTVQISDGTTFRCKGVARSLARNFKTILVSETPESEGIYGLKGRVRIENTEIIELHVGRRLPGWLFTLLRLIRDRKVDVIYCCNEWKHYPFLLLAARITSVRLIFEAHSILTEEQKHRVSVINYWRGKLTESLVMKESDRVVALSDTIVQHYSAIAKMPLCLVPAFIELAKVSKPVEPRSSPERRRLGLIGPFYLPRNLLDLEFMAAQLGELDERIAIIAVGTPPESFKESRIEFTGYIPDKEAFLDEIRSLDAVVIPSVEGTFGPLTKILEPMSLGVPVLTTPQGIVGFDSVVDGNNILVFPPDGLIKGINTTLFDDGLLKRVGESARATIVEWHSQEGAEKALAHLVIDVTKDKGGS